MTSPNQNLLLAQFLLQNGIQTNFMQIPFIKNHTENIETHNFGHYRLNGNKEGLMEVSSQKKTKIKSRTRKYKINLSSPKFFTQFQFNILLEAFHENRNPNTLQKKELASKTGLKYVQVSKWFSNRKYYEEQRGYDTRTPENEGIVHPETSNHHVFGKVNQNDFDFVVSEFVNMSENDGSAAELLLHTQSSAVPNPETTWIELIKNLIDKPLKNEEGKSLLECFQQHGDNNKLGTITITLEATQSEKNQLIFQRGLSANKTNKLPQSSSILKSFSIESILSVPYVPKERNEDTD